MLKLRVQIDDAYIKKLIIKALNEKVGFPVSMDSITLEVMPENGTNYTRGRVRAEVECMFDD